MEKKPIKRIAAIMPYTGGSVNARKAAGILDFAQRRRDWDVRIFTEPHRDTWPKVLDWQPHGIVISREPTGMGDIPLVKVPLVIMDSPQNVKTACPQARFVFADDIGIANEAARRLIGKGFRSFGYVHSQIPSLWDSLRSNTFLSHMARKRLPASEFTPTDETQDNLGRFETWAGQLPPGSAILAASDYIGVRVLTWCRLLGIPVPGHLSVLGIGNDESLCRTAIPALTSINIDFTRAGHLAASTLASLLKGGLPAHTVRYGADCVIERDSVRRSMDEADARINQALAFIDARLGEPIQIPDVAADLGCSRRSVELLFRRKLNTSVGAILRDRRLECMARRLRETRQAIYDICATSGFSSESHAKRLFKSKYGKTMSDWRRADNPERDA